MEDYRVLLKVNSDGAVTAINSSAFAADTAGQVEIDSGTGDKYHHAQGNYLEKGLFDEHGCYNYKYVDGELEERTAEDKATEIQALEKIAEIARLKNEIKQYDYIGVKIAQGRAKKAEYAEEIAKAQELADRINELESELI